MVARSAEYIRLSRLIGMSPLSDEDLLGELIRRGRIQVLTTEAAYYSQYAVDVDTYMRYIDDKIAREVGQALHDKKAFKISDIPFREEEDGTPVTSIRRVEVMVVLPEGVKDVGDRGSVPVA